MKSATDLVDAGPVEGKPLDQARIGKLFDETLAVARIITELCLVLMIEIIDRTMEGGMEGLETEEIDVGAPEKTSELCLPFFLDEEDLRLQRTDMER
jgi:hypothetical protein